MNNTSKLEFTCISCPKGCKLKGEKNNDNIIITGNSCKYGIEYGIQEIKDPRRNISSTVIIEKAQYTLLPIKTSSPIPKNLIFNVMNVIKSVKVTAPIKRGSVIIENVCNTGCNIVAAKTIEAI